MTEDTKEKDPKLEAELGQEVKLNMRIPTRMPSVIAHHLTIQPSEDGVLLSFYEVIPPVIRGEIPSQDEIKRIKETGVTAECVSKVFIPNSRYEAFVTAMSSILPNENEKEGE